MYFKNIDKEVVDCYRNLIIDPDNTKLKNISFSNNFNLVDLKKKKFNCVASSVLRN